MLVALRNGTSCRVEENGFVKRPIETPAWKNNSKYLFF